MTELAPPPYLPTASSSTCSLPRYSAGPVELPLCRLPSYSSFSTAPTAAGDYLYSSKHLTLNLGKRIFGTGLPSYGNNAIIQGTVTVMDFSHVQEITLTISGKAFTVVSDGGYTLARQAKTVLEHSISLWSSSSPTPNHPQTYNIAFPLPTYAHSSNSLLPPSVSTTFPDTKTEITYSISVDMVRVGLRRHESASTNFLYLPLSLPRNLVRRPGEPHKCETMDGVEWDLHDVRPVWKGNGTGAQVQLGLLHPLSYTAGVPIPFRLSFASPYPTTSEQLQSKLVVQLVRIVTLTVKKQKMQFARLIGTAQVWKASQEEGDDGAWELTGAVVGGRPNGDATWNLSGFADVQYVIRFKISANGLLPAYYCERTIQLATSERHEFQIDEDWSRPALGFLDKGGLSKL